MATTTKRPLAQQMQQPQPQRTQQPPAGPAHVALTIEVQLCITDDAERHAPRRRTAPTFLPPEAPVPRKGEVVFLSPTSPWAVSLVTHQWRNAHYLRVEVWLEPLGAISRPAGFALTQ